MLTLILDGSPRRAGDTSHMIAALRAGLTGDVEEVSAYRAAISPCVDCRYCHSHPACAIDDDMTRVYGLIERADCVVIASPVYFSELTGRLLDVCSRLQRYYAYRRFGGGESPVRRHKRGAILLCGGGEGAPDRACATARELLRAMGADDVRSAMCLATDSLPAARDEAALASARELGRWLAGK